MYQVKSGIPVPAGERGVKKYPFDAMDVGDYFDVPRKDNNGNSIRTSSHSWVNRNNPSAKFTVRTIDDKTIRCWRIA